MKTWLGLCVLLGMSMLFGSSRQSRSEETADGAAADERPREAKELVEQSVDWYEVLPEADAKVGLRPQVVLRWRNTVRINTGAALLAIWTDHGRPEAMATIFQTGDQICHEMGSLSRSKKIVVRDKTRVVWSSGKAGVEFRDVPDAPAPADDQAARLRQMKSLAERFTARLRPLDASAGTPEVLRLLPRPLYRYDIKDSKGQGAALRDGGMFAFVMGTDPEVVLLLEAAERDNKVVWQYAFARATAYAVDASLGDEVVWSVNAASGPTPTDSLMQIFRGIPPSP
ncbi:MAG TPA: hypothetical protein VJ783_24805 [Pirellulales bacterium]|nr:hypothetical protein [Pirellulales bacterium]